MPDIPEGEAVDAQNYLRFLTIMREKLGIGNRTLSIALPASFWYLELFLLTIWPGFPATSFI